MLIRLATSDEDAVRCFPVMKELRQHLDQAAFLARVKRQHAIARYQLAYVDADAEVRSVAGFRVSEALAWGKFLYVDDLVTRKSDHGSGYGKALFEWLLGYARANGCETFHLDSGVQRFGAHRFYLSRGMDITSHHFAMKLK